MINVGIIGATGYAGMELVRILSNHPNVKIMSLTSKSYAGKKISDVYPYFNNLTDIVCEKFNIEHIANNCDLVFTALPHGASSTIVPKLINNNLKVIDLSGDFRYQDISVYEKWYGISHNSPELFNKSVYGLCEIYKEKIAASSLIGNPGCYTTCSILGTLPLLSNNTIYKDNIIIDAKSGVSGAGRNATLNNQFCECTENIKAYKIASHRHTSEIEQELSKVAGNEIIVSFTPHLIPIKRGILCTIYANLKDKYSTSDLLDMYQSFYKNNYFVRIYKEGLLPEIKNVRGSNFIDIGLKVDNRLNRVIVISAIDNLIKGAAGQAVQNMNIMMGLDEKTGLDNPGLYL